MNQKIEVIYEDRDLIVCRKLPGIPVQTAKLAQLDMVSLLRNYYIEKGEEDTQIFVVHRLDQPVEGVIIFARNQRAAAELSRQSRERKMDKIYLALAEGIFTEPSGVLEDYLWHDRKTNSSRVVEQGTQGAKMARLAYEVENVYHMQDNSADKIFDRQVQQLSDIIVTTDTNYVFQLYYNESYGKKFIEYIGRNTGKGTEWYPKLKASYEEGKITAKAMEKTSETIEKLELIYRGGLVDQREGNSPELNAEFNVTQTGWYILRATSSTGKLRYAWVRAANTLLAPKIEINTAGEQENGWYGKDNVPVTVKITAASESTKGIYYSLDRWASEEYVDRKNSHNRKYKQSRNNNSIRLCNR